MHLEAFTPDAPRYADFRAFADHLYEGDPFWSPPDDPPAALDPYCFLLYDHGRIAARACVTRRPPGGGGDDDVTATCGWYECVDDERAAIALLDGVRAHARARGFERIVGPLNGSTWHRYRFADPSATPPFFLDVHNKPWYVAHWIAAGMEEIAHYHSTSFEDLAPYDGGEATAARIGAHGITLREMRLDRFEEELRTIHALSTIGFRDNALYTPIDVDAFVDLYRPLRPLVRPELVLIAERDEGEPAGFVFAIDNVYERRWTSLVMKSAAVVPEVRGLGLGHHLLETVHRTARDRKYDQVIHALMIRGNRSAAILAERSAPYRTYRLFGCGL